MSSATQQIRREPTNPFREQQPLPDDEIRDIPFLGAHTVLGGIYTKKDVWSQIPFLCENEGKAPPFILVSGSRGRAKAIAKLMEDAVIVDEKAKEFGGNSGRVVVAIGKYKGVPILVVETQMGMPANEIILTEILNNQITNRDYKVGSNRFSALNKYVLRVGSAGGLNAPEEFVRELAEASGLDPEELVNFRNEWRSKEVKTGDLVNVTHSCSASGADIQHLAGVNILNPDVLKKFREEWRRLGGVFHLRLNAGSYEIDSNTVKLLMHEWTQFHNLTLEVLSESPSHSGIKPALAAECRNQMANLHESLLFLETEAKENRHVDIKFMNSLLDNWRAFDKAVNKAFSKPDDVASKYLENKTNVEALFKQFLTKTLEKYSLPEMGCSGEVVKAINETAKNLGMKDIVHTGKNFSKDSLYAELAEYLFAGLRLEHDCKSTEMELSTLLRLAAERGDTRVGLISALVGTVPGGSFGSAEEAEQAEAKAVKLGLEAMALIGNKYKQSNGSKEPLEAPMGINATGGNTLEAPVGINATEGNGNNGEMPPAHSNVSEGNSGTTPPPPPIDWLKKRGVELVLSEQDTAPAQSPPTTKTVDATKQTVLSLLRTHEEQIVQGELIEHDANEKGIDPNLLIACLRQLDREGYVHLYLHPSQTSESETILDACSLTKQGRNNSATVSAPEMKETKREPDEPIIVLPSRTEEAVQSIPPTSPPLENDELPGPTASQEVDLTSDQTTVLRVLRANGGSMERPAFTVKAEAAGANNPLAVAQKLERLGFVTLVRERDEKRNRRYVSGISLKGDNAHKGEA